MAASAAAFGVVRRGMKVVDSGWVSEIVVVPKVMARKAGSVTVSRGSDRRVLALILVAGVGKTK